MSRHSFHWLVLGALLAVEQSGSATFAYSKNPVPPPPVKPLVKPAPQPQYRDYRGYAGNQRDYRGNVGNQRDYRGNVGNSRRYDGTVTNNPWSVRTPPVTKKKR